MKRYCGIAGFIFFFLHQIALAGDLSENADWQNHDDSSKVTGKAYFRGRPLPECKEFWILEEHFEKRLSGGRNNGESDGYSLSFDIGHMFNISRRHSLGGTFYISAGDDHDYLGIKFRHRYWITQQLAWDLSPGFIIGSDDNSYKGRIRFPGLTMSTFLYYGDWGALNLTFDAFKIKANDPRQTNRNVTSLYGGVTLGSYPAAIGIVAAVVIAIFIMPRSIVL